MKTVLHVLGARPNYVKASPVINAINFANQVILNTGQHYDKILSSDIALSLKMKEPDINLSLPSGQNTYERLSYLIEKLSDHFLEIKPDIVILYGDVDSTLAAALVAARMEVPIAHVESGLRSYDNTMPEEINRKVVDVLSSIHFVTESSGLKNLYHEGFEESVHFVGNSMIDSLVSVMNSDLYESSEYENFGNILLTCHRPSNVDNYCALTKILDMCKSLKRKVIWPVHPRTLHKMKEYNLLQSFENLENLELIDPLDYCNFLKMMATSTAVITDSGGIQEETTFLNIPCLTIRENTERPVTITEGSNTLTSFEDVASYIELIYNNKYKNSEIPQLWDGKASVRMANVILKFMQS